MVRPDHDWKAVFTDIDGTLLDSSRDVTTATRETLGRCVREGVRVVLSSSRSPQGIEPIASMLGFDCSVIAFGGALILDEGRTMLYERGMVRREAAEVVGFVESELGDVTWNVFTADRWIVRSREDPRVVREEGIVRTLSQEGSVHDVADDEPVDKVLCMCPQGRAGEVAGILGERFPRLSITRSSDILVEVNAAGVSKATALRVYCGAVRIPVDHTIAFGDSYNDLEMLEAAGMGVAMGNAPDDIRAVADLVTEDNDHDGIAHALRTLMA